MFDFMFVTAFDCERLHTTFENLETFTSGVQKHVVGHISNVVKELGFLWDLFAQQSMALLTNARNVFVWSMSMIEFIHQQEMCQLCLMKNIHITINKSLQENNLPIARNLSFNTLHPGCLQRSYSNLSNIVIDSEPNPYGIALKFPHHSLQTLETFLFLLSFTPTMIDMYGSLCFFFA